MGPYFFFFLSGIFDGFDAHVSPSHGDDRTGAHRTTVVFGSSRVLMCLAPVGDFATGRCVHIEMGVHKETTQECRPLSSFPLWIFNANNYGNPGLSDRVLSTSLPKEFYTTASVVRSYTKIKFDPTLVQVFAVFQGVAILFVWAVLVWAVSVRRSLPEISSFPIFDAEFKAEARGHQVPDAKGVWAYRDGDILDSMRHVKVERRVV